MSDPSGLVSHVRSADVTLGDQARAEAERYEIATHSLRLARALSISTYETPEWIVAVGRLPDHRRVRMCCSPERPAHIVKLRLV